MIRQRMDYDDGIFAGFDHLVQVANGSVANSGGEWSIVPYGFFTFQQEPAN
jgi:hypothetical protein